MTVPNLPENLPRLARAIGEGEKLNGQLGHLDRPHDRGQPNKGISAAARHFGISRTEVRRAFMIDSLDDTAKTIARDLALDDNQSALLAAARATEPAEQVAILREIRARKSAPKAPTTAATTLAKGAERVARLHSALPEFAAECAKGSERALELILAAVDLWEGAAGKRIRL